MIGFLKVIVFLVVLGISVAISFRIKKGREVEGGDIPIGIRSKGGFITGVALVIASLFLLGSIGAIPAGYRGVVLRLGAVTDRILPEGFYVVTPVLDSVEVMSVQVRAYVVPAASASKDLQDVQTQITLNYYAKPELVAKIYQSLRHDYEERIIHPAIQECVKSSTTLFDAEQLIVERPKVKQRIEEVLKDRLESHGFGMEAVSITDFNFSPEFTKAIETKVTAQQNALKEKNNLEAIKYQAQQKIESAKAEAESLRLQREQVTSELIDLRRVEMQRIALEKWNGVLPTVVTGSGPVPILDIFKGYVSGVDGVHK